MPWFPRDFRSATLGWSHVAKSIYRDLLDAQWDLGKLPIAPEALRRIVGATDAEWSDAWAHCEDKFPVVDGARCNRRMSDDREFIKRRHERRVITGRQNRTGNGGSNGSGNAPSSAGSNAPTDAQSNTGAMPGALHKHPDPYPDPNKNPEPEPKTGEVNGVLALDSVENLSQSSTLRHRAKMRGVPASEKNPDEDRPLIMHASLPKATWAHWIGWRKRHRMPLDERTLGMHLKLLARFTEAQQSEIIETSINAGWQGLFALKGVKGALDAPRPRLKSAAELEAEERQHGSG